MPSRLVKKMTEVATFSFRTLSFPLMGFLFSASLTYSVSDHNQFLDLGKTVSQGNTLLRGICIAHTIEDKEPLCWIKLAPVFFLSRGFEPALRVQNLLLRVLGCVPVEGGHDERVLPAVLVLGHAQQERPGQPEPREELLEVAVGRVDVDWRHDHDGREEQADQGEGDGGAARAAAAAAAGVAAATPRALLAHGEAVREAVGAEEMRNRSAPEFSVKDQEGESKTVRLGQ